MNAQPFSGSTTGAAAAGDDEQDAKTMPLGVGDFAEDDAVATLTAGGESRRLGGGILIFVFILGMAGAGLWFMRSLSQVSAMEAGDSEIEKSIERFVVTLSGGKGAAAGTSGQGVQMTSIDVLDVLNRRYTEEQVSLENVKCDPFILPGEGEPQPVVAASGGPDQSEMYSKLRRDREAAIERAASRFTLKSVIMGSQPLANIDGKIVRKGDEIVSPLEQMPFRVADIISTAVTVVAEDPSLNLSVEFTIQLRRDK